MAVAMGAVQLEAGVWLAVLVTPAEQQIWTRRPVPWSPTRRRRAGETSCARAIYCRQHRWCAHQDPAEGKCRWTWRVQTSPLERRATSTLPCPSGWTWASSLHQMQR